MVEENVEAETDGYESCEEYYRDNQLEEHGEILNELPEAYDGPVGVSMQGSLHAYSVVMPSVDEAVLASKLAANPNSGGYRVITLVPCSAHPTHENAYEWLTGGSQQ